MKMVLQVVNDATLSVNGDIISSINKGLVVFFCVEKGDLDSDLDYFAKKIASLRIFDDENGKTNLSVKDVNGEVLLVSQFTLAGDYHHGNRPSFINAEEQSRAKEMYENLAEIVRKNYGITVKMGVFGEEMIIKQTNAGPFTAFLEKKN